MFKNLKKKLEQGVAQSPLRGALNAVTKQTEEAPSSPGEPIAESTPKKENNVNQKVNATDSMVTVGEGATVGQLVDIPLQEESPSTTNDFSSALSQLPGDDTPRVGRSRTSSISSVTSDSFFTNTSFGPQHHYALPSDVESEVEEQVSSLDAYSKEDLYQLIRKYERRSIRYKSKFMEVANIYKDVVNERDKVKTTLTQTQDRAFRRISELKEQIQLDQLAKKDLEDNYRLMLEEKDEHLKVFRTQVRLLREGKEIPPELDEQLKSKKSPTKPPVTGGPGGDGKKEDGDAQQLTEKVKRLEGLLSRCKETIRSNKEKCGQLEEENAKLTNEIKELTKLKGSTSPDQLSKLQKQIRQAREVIEQLEADRELAIAEVKQQVHEEIQTKDEEVVKAREQVQIKDRDLVQARQQVEQLQHENQTFQEQVDKLEKAAREKLEKSREIVKRLKEEKQKLQVDMEERIQAMKAESQERIQSVEKTMDEEKESLVQELSKAKAAAISCMQEFYFFGRKRQRRT